MKQKSAKPKKRSCARLWTDAVLITVARHRNAQGELTYSESIFHRTGLIPANFERIWEQKDTQEPYQARIQELLGYGHVVLKTIA